VAGQGKARKAAGAIHPTAAAPTRLRPTRARIVTDEPGPRP
jgi:hypothetical protein